MKECESCRLCFIYVLEALVAKYGEEHRQLITDEMEKPWHLTANFELYIKKLIELTKESKQ